MAHLSVHLHPATSPEKISKFSRELPKQKISRRNVSETYRPQDSGKEGEKQHGNYTRIQPQGWCKQDNRWSTKL